MKRLFDQSLGVAFSLSLLFLGGCSTQQSGLRQDGAPPATINLDTVRAGQFDTGKMWTFDYAPVEYFAKTYHFNPTKEWFEKARLSALRLPNCTASFVSEDGLVMTNHHCAREPMDAVTKEGERLAELGFYASTIDDERKVPHLYIDQLVVTEDVTAEVQRAFDSGKTDDEKVQGRAAKIAEIQQRYASKFKESSKDSMIFSVIPFYNGGRYSVYGYKRYTDIRLVYAPEEATAFYGGDPDNFTYPRYDLDVSFFRVYDSNGKPLKTANFFRFSKEGAKEGDAVFVIGNPGRTSRLLTVSQLEFNRDLRYPYILSLLEKMKGVYSDYVAKNPDKRLKYDTQIFSLSNSQKAYSGQLGGLRDPYLMARKKDFEKNFKTSVMNRTDLKGTYGDEWSQIESRERERSKLYGEVNAYLYRGFGRSVYLAVASDIVDYATQMKLPEDQRDPRYKGSGLERMKQRLYPAEFVPQIEAGLLSIQLGLMQQAFGSSNEAFHSLLGGRTPAQAARDITSSSVISSKEKVTALLNGNPDEILKSTDPLIAFVVKTQDMGKQVRDRYNELGSQETARVQELGRALYDVFGTSIPPDATFTLRIADGLVKGYEYNGTLAPPFTTFYGLYDRYYSFGKKDPWALPDRWKNPPAAFDLSTPFNFVSTNDIIGGNSGSPVVSVNLEVVGLIFDGNIESLPGDVIFTEEKNRAVSVHSSGILEALQDIYKADRIVKELKASKIQ